MKEQYKIYQLVDEVTNETRVNKTIASIQADDVKINITPKNGPDGVYHIYDSCDVDESYCHSTYHGKFGGLVTGKATFNIEHVSGLRVVMDNVPLVWFDPHYTASFLDLNFFKSDSMFLAACGPYSGGYPTLNLIAPDSSITVALHNGDGTNILEQYDQGTIIELSDLRDTDLNAVVRMANIPCPVDPETWARKTVELIEYEMSSDGIGYDLDNPDYYNEIADLYMSLVQDIKDSNNVPSLLQTYAPEILPCLYQKIDWYTEQIEAREEREANEQDEQDE